MIVESVAAGLGAGLSNSVAQLVEKAFLGIMQNSKEGVSVLRTKFSVGFERYISTTLSQCINVKTLISSNHPVSLEKAYEPVRLSFSDTGKIHIDKFIEELESKHKRCLIVATLGAGKSFTMRYIYSILARSELMDKIPIFVELRNVIFDSENLISHINKKISVHNNFSSERAVQAGLKAGVFTLILDGYDEISTKHMKEAQKQINRISEDFPGCIIIVSSRPDRERFLGWHSFTEYSVMPLTINQLESMIDRIEYNEDEKKAFIGRVKGGLFRTHERLLSNPLLASMMLLTFREFQDIPSKMHVFYGTAFDVLFRRHDTIKLDFHREFRTSLELDDFKKVFMTFCFSSYIDKQHSFKENQFNKYSSIAFEYENVEVRPDNFKHDLVNNVCIMQKEGDDISFIHRSFQEYFTAMFLTRRSVPEVYDFVDLIISTDSPHNDGCAKMLIDIDSEEFERKYLIKKLSLIKKDLEGVKTDRHKIDFISPMYVVGRMDSSQENFYFSPWDSSLGGQKKSVYKLLRLLSDNYKFPAFSIYTDSSNE